MEPGAAPAAAARNRSTGRPRDPTGRYYGRSARSSLHWPRANAGFKKRGPGDRNRRSGAPRGAPPSQRRRRASPGVSGGFAGRPRGFANPCVSRRSAPSLGAKDLDRTTAYPAPQRIRAMTHARFFPLPALRGEVGFRVKRESRVRGCARPLTRLAPSGARHPLPLNGEREEGAHTCCPPLMWISAPFT
jgi:hypothetical protein